jgi:hypothetical protein
LIENKDQPTVSNNESVQIVLEREVPPQVNAPQMPVRRKNKRKYEDLSNAVHNLKALSENLNSSEDEPSEFEAFSKYVQKCMENLDPIDATLAQQEIQSILTKYKLKSLEKLRNGEQQGCQPRGMNTQHL